MGTDGTGKNIYIYILYIKYYSILLYFSHILILIYPAWNLTTKWPDLSPLQMHLNLVCLIILVSSSAHGHMVLQGEFCICFYAECRKEHSTGFRA